MSETLQSFIESIEKLAALIASAGPEVSVVIIMNALGYALKFMGVPTKRIPIVLCTAGPAYYWACCPLDEKFVGMPQPIVGQLGYGLLWTVVAIMVYESLLKGVVHPLLGKIGIFKRSDGTSFFEKPKQPEIPDNADK